MSSVFTCIACHSKNDFTVSVIIHNLSVFLPVSKKIVICDSENMNNNLEKKIKEAYPDDIHKIEFMYVENNEFYCYHKYCTIIDEYCYMLDEYDKIILTNDSYIYAKNNNVLSTMLNTDIDVQSILESYEIKYHLTDFLRIYSYKALINIHMYYKLLIIDPKYKNISNAKLIQLFEIGSTTLFKNHSSFFKEQQPININFIEPYRKDYLLKTEYPIIKNKIFYFANYSSNQLPDDFNPSVYKKLHYDLSKLTDNDAINHFKNHGIKEGRKYKYNQKIVLPDYIVEILKENNIKLALDLNNLDIIKT